MKAETGGGHSYSAIERVGPKCAARHELEQTRRRHAAAQVRVRRGIRYVARPGEERPSRVPLQLFHRSDSVAFATIGGGNPCRPTNSLYVTSYPACFSIGTNSRLVRSIGRI